MKKSTLALSVAAALGGLVFAGNASAMGALTAGVATALERNPDGIGHQLIVPYFSAQGDNATLLEITNHDTTNAKLVKVRFRGASNSDDLYDFTLMLSPGDVWTAAVSKDATTGAAKLVSSDKSCLLPAGANNGVFSTAAGSATANPRIDGTLTGDAFVAQTREGYVEILNMADLPPTQNALKADNTTGAGALFTAVKHVSGVAPCTSAVLDNNLGSDAADNTAAAARGMVPPTGLLSADWVIINQANTAAWSGAATALQARNGAGGPNAAGTLVFWPQKFGTPSIAIATATADPLLTSGIISPQWYDLPDLSTPVINTDANAATRADATTTQLAIKTLAHQFVTSSSIAAVTDVVFSQPTRRYNVAVNYKAGAAGNNVTTTTGTNASPNYRAGQTFYTTNNTALGTSPFNRVVCVNSVNAPSIQQLFDREETSPTTGSTSFVISPNIPTAATVLQLCGETSVVSINQGGITNPSSAVSGSIARSDVTFDSAYVDGWATWWLGGANNNAAGFPMIANTFIRARNGTVNYGFGWPAKVTR